MTASRDAPVVCIRDFRVLCKKAGIEGVWAPRELRHTFVSVMSESGVAVEEIARLAGHASSRTTETIYRHELRPVITTGADIMDNFAVGLLCEMMGYGVPVVVVPHCKPQLASHPAFSSSSGTLRGMGVRVLLKRHRD